jgi:hypothetical protein
MLKAKGADLSNPKVAGKFDGFSEAWSKATTPNFNFSKHDEHENKEESPYKPDPVLLRGITIHLDL